MDMREFFSLILPDEGYKFIAVNAKRHIAATTTEHLAEIAEANDTGKNNVFHSCASFVHSSYIGDDGKTHQRTQEDALCAKSFWLDLDVGEGKDYPSQAAAVSAIVRFCKAINLPPPMLINSGVGVHCYWILDAPLEAAKWTKIATLFAKVLQQQGVLVDGTRTADISSLLRPVGVTHRKDPKNPKPVTCLRKTTPIKAVTFLNVLLAAKRPDDPPKGKGKPKVKSNASFMGAAELPDIPKDANAVADKCAQINFFRKTGSNDYNQWWNALCVVAHCVDGDKLAHEWGKQSDTYDKSETEFKLRDMRHGPSTCEKFKNYAKLCDGCEFAGKIKSPISLGVVAPVAPTILTSEPVESDESAQQAETHELHIAPPYGIDNNGVLTYYRKDDDGILIPYNFCSIAFAPYARFPEDGQMVVAFKARVRQLSATQWQWKTFNIPAAIIGGKGTELFKELAKHEVYALPGMQKHMETYVTVTADDLRRRIQEINSRQSMGWQNDKSFVLGKRCVTEDGDKPLILNGKNVSRVVPAFPEPSGNVEKWTEAINGLYNHPEHEQFQYVIYMGFGSVLIDMWGQEVGSNFVNLYGAASAGKTSAIHAALSAYSAKPEELLKSFKTGITTNAIYAMHSALKSIPLGIDEVTNIPPNELSDLSYALSTGKQKLRLGQRGEIITQGEDFKCTTFGSSNAPLVPRLGTFKDNAFAEMSRIIEIPWRKDIQLIPASEARVWFEQLNANAGTAAPIFVQYVVQNRAEVRKMLEKVRQKLDRDADISTDYRFWSAQHAAGITAGILATQLGLLPFKKGNVYNYVKNLITGNRTQLEGHVVSPDASFNAMVNAMSNAIIVTRTVKDSRSEAPEDVKVIGEPVGRVVRDKAELYVATHAIRDWCNKRQIDYSTMKKAMVERGVVTSTDVLFTIGKGTKCQTAPARCWRVDVNALEGVVVEKVTHLSVVNA